MVPNAVAALVLVPVLLALTALAIRLDRKAALPVVIHNLLWAFTILLVGSDLIEYRQASLAAWGVLLVGLVFFNLGALLGAAWARQQTRSLDLRTDLSMPQDTVPVGLVGRRGLALLIGLYGIGFATYLYVIHVRFGLATLVTSPTTIRAAPDSYLASVPLWARLLLYIGPMLFALLLVKGGVVGQLKLATRVILLAGLALTMVALLQRANLFIGAAWGAAALFMAPPTWLSRGGLGSTSRGTSRGRSFRTVGTLTLVAAGLIAGFQVIGGALGKSADTPDGSGQLSPILQATGLTGLFRYLTTGVPAFLLLTESTNNSWPPIDMGRVLYGDYNPQTWGAATFEPIVSLIPGLRAWNPVDAFVDVGVQTNVFTWLEPFYRDFRVVGVGLGVFLLGMLVTYLYATRSWSARRFWIAALLLSIVFFCTFAQRISSTPYLFALVLVTVVSAASPNRYRPRGRLPAAESA
jgi:hypothetical protein